MEKNLMLPGNPRYQPEELTDYLGYDNLAKYWTKIELAKLEVMYEIGFISKDVWCLLTDDVKESLFEITTTEVDMVERKITKHDVNAHNRLLREKLPPELARFVHLPLTSYDKISTANSLVLRDIFFHVIRPKIIELLNLLADMVEEYADVAQIGRTHGQHALPITVGFWLANILHRLASSYNTLEIGNQMLCGKISGAVGAYNAQEALRFNTENEISFEKRVLEKLDLTPAAISSQIISPEETAFFLFGATMFSASLAQLGRDCRHLMRTEIGEILEGFEDQQVGSSTMAHKRNPINFENTEGMWLRNKNEFGKVLDNLISEHQRDLVNSSAMRDWPIILVNLTVQLNTLLRKDEKTKTPFIKRIKVDRTALENNLAKQANVIMAEPLYISLQLAGYEGDAHNLVNHILVAEAKKTGQNIFKVAENLAEQDDVLRSALQKIPDETKALFDHPEKYTGSAEFKAREIADIVRDFINSN
jgi:adenylosuccinate lyase